MVLVGITEKNLGEGLQSESNEKTPSQALMMASRDTSLSTPPMGSVLFQNLLKCLAPLNNC